MRHYSEILVRPWVSEKGMDYAAHNTYPFEVRREANKIQIKQAVETRYGVTVTGVRTMIVAGKPRNFRRTSSTVTRSRKKALVTLKEGDNIDFL
jgi:large subunit ribosomal protein L23